MKLIANSGDGRSYAFGALKRVKNRQFEEADELMEKSNEAIDVAHNTQTELLIKEASGEEQDISLLMIHAQDHFMTSLLANELIKEIILLYRDRQN
ncbi:PTS lactose/cellobiose transporter subunit IIA [Vagococcus coleopterorum]